jgi:hypothetical protein
MSPVTFEPTPPARERPQAHALDLAVTEIGFNFIFVNKLQNF